MATTPAPAKKAAARKPATKTATKAPETPAEAPVEDPQAAAEPVEAPVTLPEVQHAPLEAPKAPEPAAAAPAPAQYADAAVGALTAGQSVAVLCERTGEPAQASCLFTDPEGGLVRAKCRVLEKGVTMAGRKVTRLLLAEGSVLTEAAAEQIKAQVTELNAD